MVVVRSHIRKGKIVKKYVRGKPKRLVAKPSAPTKILMDPRTGRIFGRVRVKKR